MQKNTACFPSPPPLNIVITKKKILMKRFSGILIVGMVLLVLTSCKRRCSGGWYGNRNLSKVDLPIDKSSHNKTYYVEYKSKTSPNSKEEEGKF